MEYFVRFHAKTVAAFLERAEQQEKGYGWIEFDDNTICYDILRQHGHDWIHWGIGINTIVEADAFEEAVQTARNHVIPIYNLISFSTNTEVGYPREMLAFVYGEGVEERAFRQFFRPTEAPIPVGSVRKIDLDFLSQIYERLNSVGSDSRCRKLIRALDSYSSALRQKTPTDSFVWFYIAFDTLEELFVSHYGVETTHTHICPECGAETGTSHRHNAGKQAFLDRHSKIDVAHRDFADIRNPLLHSGKIGDAPDYRDDIEKAVRVGLLEVLDFDTEEHESIIGLETNGHLRAEDTILTGAISGYEPIPLEHISEQPTAEMSNKDVEYSIVGDKLRRKPRQRITFDSDRGVELETMAVSLRHEGNAITPEMSDTEVEFKNHEEN